MKRPEQPDPSPGASPYLERAALPALQPPEPFTGAEIIQEVPTGPAVLLCQAYRAVMLWAATPPREHAELFAPSTEEGNAWDLLDVTPMADDLRGALEVVRALIADAAGADPRAVAGACTRITDWGLRRDAPDTAYRFAQAAGMCAANDARLAYRAGCMARRRSEWYLAKLWFRHAIAVGRRTRDWEGHAMGYLALGNTYLQQGRYSSARKEHLKALRVGRRHGFAEIRGRAYHDLLLVAIEVGDLDAAEKNARAAFQAYGPSHSNVPALAHDIAYFWNTRGYSARALRVFKALLPHFREPGDRVRVLASVARAAGGCGDGETFARSLGEVWSLVSDLDGSAVVTTSLMQVAYGAASLSEWETAETAASRALHVAQRRSESDVVASAEELLDWITARVLTVEMQLPSRTLESASEADLLAADLVSALEGSAGPP